MIALPTKRREWCAVLRGWWGCCARLLWLVMLIGHLPAWVAAIGDGGESTGGGLLRWGLLTASQLFFALKVVDVAWLRLPCDRRRRWAFVAAIALLHADVVRQSVAPGADPCAAVPVVFLGAALAGAAIRPVTLSADPVPGARKPAWSGDAVRLQAWLAHALWTAWRPRLVILVRAGRVCRAPPI